MQKVHGHFTFIKLPLDESNRFHYLFKTPFGSFHHFPHGTCSLSNYNSGLGVEGGPPRFKQNLTCFVLLFTYFFLLTGLSPSLAYSFHRNFQR